MRHLAHPLALAAAIVLAGTAADAAPRKARPTKAQRAAKARATRRAEARAQVVAARLRLAAAREAAEADDEDGESVARDDGDERDDRDDQADDDIPVRPARLAGRTKRKAARITHARKQAEADDEADADADADESDDREVASAKPAHGKHHHGKRAHDDADDAADADDSADDERPAKRHRDTRADDADDAGDDSDDRVAFASRDPEGDAIGEEIEMPAADASRGDDDTALVVKHTLGARHAKKWSVSFGPYLWASSVDASVAVGAANVSTGADFTQMSQHAKFGAEALAELRYGRFSFSGDVMYGVLGLEGARDVGPVMVTYDGTATSTLIDGIGGVTLYGNDHSLFSIEARGGLRYQRTVMQASVGVAGAGLDTPTSVDSGADAIAGGRVFVRPTPRVFASAAVDTRVFGASNNTWSATADAGVRLGHFQLSLGYRTVTEDRNNTNVRMYGPRAAVQLAF